MDMRCFTRIKGNIRKGNSERKVFVKLLEEKMSMSQFLDRLKHTDDATGSQPNVLYCSRQNNSLLDGFRLYKGYRKTIYIRNV